MSPAATARRLIVEDRERDDAEREPRLLTAEELHRVIAAEAVHTAIRDTARRVGIETYRSVVSVAPCVEMRRVRGVNNLMREIRR